MSQCHDLYDEVWQASKRRAYSGGPGPGRGVPAPVTQCHDLYPAPASKDEDQPATEDDDQPAYATVPAGPPEYA